MPYSDIEKEIIFLKAIQELIDKIVNYEVLDLSRKDPDSEIRFKSMTHQMFFNIILVDFLSLSDKHVIGEQLSYLSAIIKIYEHPNFNQDNSIDFLSVSAKEFVDWLEQEVKVNVWLPAIETDTELSIKRIEFIKICGNISKHNFSRLFGVSKELKQIFKRNDIKIDFEDTLLILDDLYERFHTDILNYHSSTITEFLNNIRWGIYEYLLPEYNQSMQKNDENLEGYKFTYPKGVDSKFSRNCYWDLMNWIRRKPFVERFKVTRWLKLRY